LNQTWTVVTDSRSMVAKARIPLPIELHKNFFPYDIGKLCSIGLFGVDRSINNVTILSTDAGHWTLDTGRTRDTLT